MKKRILITLAALTMLLCVPLIANAQIVNSGDCGADGDNLTWTFDDEGTLTISGEGDMDDYDYYESVPWYNIHSSITKIIIDQDVTSICSSAFYDCDGLASVTIPDNVTSIGSSVFYDCDGLTSITIPDSVTIISCC